MTLEVGGSNPSVHPILPQILGSKIKNILPEIPKKNKFVTHLHKLLTKTTIIHFIKIGWDYNKLHLAFLIYPLKQQRKLTFFKDFLYTDFKTLGYQNEILRVKIHDIPLSRNYQNLKTKPIKIFYLFKSFLKSNMSTDKNPFRPHYSFNFFYILNRKGGLGFTSIGKFFSK